MLRWSEHTTWEQPGFRVATCDDESCLCPPMVPIEGKSVTIPMGARVLLDVDTPVLNGVMIHGELIFEDKPGVGLSAHWVMIMDEGSALRIGAEDTPFVNETHITLHGTKIHENVSGEAPPWTSGTKFLMAMDGGTLALHGVSREKRSWTKLAANASAGDSTITVADAHTGWQVGDRLAIGPSGYHYNEAADVTITAIDGASITFNPALEADRWGELQEYGGRAVDQRTPVGLLTRNIRIQGAEDSLLLRSEMAYFPGYGPYTYGLPLDVPLNFGAHVMIMGGLGGRPTAYAYVEGVEFTRTGQMSLQGRYTFHWHWVGDATGQYFRNNSVHHSFQRAVNVHRTSNTLVENNVSYKVRNHNFVWAEDGHETEHGNRIIGNLAIAVSGQSHTVHPMAFGNRGAYSYAVGTGPDPVKQEEWRASGFWGRNVINALEGNHVAGVRDGMGYFFDIGGGSSFEPRLPLFKFHNNTAHAISDVASGLNINNDLYPPATVGSAVFIRNRNVGDLEFTGLNAFKNKLGVWVESNTHTIRDAILTDNAGGIMMFQGRIEDSLIVGVTDNLIGSDYPLVRDRSPRRLNALNAVSSGIFIFGGQGGQKTIKAANIQFFNTPGGAIRSNDVFAFHGTYFTGLEMDDQTLPLRMTGLGEGAFLDLDGLFDPDGLSRPTWLTFGDPQYVTRHSRFDMEMDAWRTPAVGETIVRFDEASFVPYGPAASSARVVENGLGFDLVGHGGVAVPLDYEITPHTVIEFFSSNNELHDNRRWFYVGVGLVEDVDDFSTPRLFGVHQSNNPGFPAYSTDYTLQYRKNPGGVIPPGQAYRIPIGRYYTGPASHLAFYGRAREDSGDRAIIRFHLVRIYEADETNFRGWPVVREVFENLSPTDDARLFFSDLFNDPRFPAQPTHVERVAPYYGPGSIHSYGNRALHTPRLHRQRMSAAMVDRSYLVVDESGFYDFAFITTFRGVALEVAPANGYAPLWTRVIFQDPGVVLSRDPRTVNGSVYLEAGKVYHWRHMTINAYNVAPDPHTLHWRKPGMDEFEPFNITYLRPFPGPLATGEPAVASVLNDAIPDWWKLEHGIDNLSDDPANLAAGIPADDGLTNLEKFLLGLNPFRMETRPVQHISRAADGTLMVSFPGLPGRRYQIETSTNLTDWYPVGSAVHPEGESPLSWEIIRNGNSPAFFRISIEANPGLFSAGGPANSGGNPGGSDNHPQSP